MDPDPVDALRLSTMTPVDNLLPRLLSGGEQELPTDIRLHARPKPIGELRTQPLSPAKYRLRGAIAVVTRSVTGARQCMRSPARPRSRPSSSRPPAAASSPASNTQLPRPPPSSTHERHSSSYSDCCETNCSCMCRSVTRVAAISVVPGRQRGTGDDQQVLSAPAGRGGRASVPSPSRGHRKSSTGSARRRGMGSGGDGLSCAVKRSGVRSNRATVQSAAIRLGFRTVGHAKGPVGDHGDSHFAREPWASRSADPGCRNDRAVRAHRVLGARRTTELRAVSGAIRSYVRDARAGRLPGCISAVAAGGPQHREAGSSRNGIGPDRGFSTRLSMSSNVVATRHAGRMRDPFELVPATAAPLPADHRSATAVPDLGDEFVLLDQAHGLPTHQDEPLVALTGNRITLLNSYARAGWQHAVAQQWLRARTIDRLRAAAEALPDEFGFAVFDGWRPLALQQELFDASEDSGVGAEVWTMVASPSPSARTSTTPPIKPNSEPTRTLPEPCRHYGAFCSTP